MIVAMLLANICMFVVMYFAIRHIARIVTVPEIHPVSDHPDDVRRRLLHDQLRHHVRCLDVADLRPVRLSRRSKSGSRSRPFIIGFILGPSAEIYFVKSLESFGTLTIFFTKSWIADLLWVLIAVSIGFSVTMSILNRRRSERA